jgi:hypothetical protein
MTMTNILRSSTRPKLQTTRSYAPFALAFSIQISQPEIWTNTESPRGPSSEVLLKSGEASASKNYVLSIVQRCPSVDLQPRTANMQNQPPSITSATPPKGKKLRRRMTGRRGKVPSPYEDPPASAFAPVGSTFPLRLPSFHKIAWYHLRLRAGTDGCRCNWAGSE